MIVVMLASQERIEIRLLPARINSGSTSPDENFAPDIAAIALRQEFTFRQIFSQNQLFQTFISFSFTCQHDLPFSFLNYM